jgi:hypothetical protein
MSQEKISNVEVLFTPDWHYSLSAFLGDLKGEIGYITEYGTVHLLGLKDPDLSKFASESKTAGPTRSITANKTLGLL